MQGELSLLRKSFHKYILITLPYLSQQNNLQTKASELCQILRDTQKTIIEVFRVVQKLQPKQDSPSPSQSFNHTPFGCLSRDSRQNQHIKQPELMYYIKQKDKIQKEPVKVQSTSVKQPALRPSPDKRLLSQKTENSNLQTSINTRQDTVATNAKTIHKAKQSIGDLQNNIQPRKAQGMNQIMKGLTNLKQMMSLNGLGIKNDPSQMGHNASLTAQKPLNSIKHIGQISFNELTPRSKEPTSIRGEKNLTERISESTNQTQPQYISPLEQYMEKQGKIHFWGKNSLLKDIQQATTEFQRDQLTLGTVYKLTSDTKESWFHDVAASPTRQSPLKRNLIYAKLDEMVDEPIEDQQERKELFYLEKI